jgi:hypothetical protein
VPEGQVFSDVARAEVFQHDVAAGPGVVMYAAQPLPETF